MPSAISKGKIPLSEVKEYDPNHDASPGMTREKRQKTTSSSKVSKPKKHVLS